MTDSSLRVSMCGFDMGMNECATGPMASVILKIFSIHATARITESQDLPTETIVALLSQLPLLEAKREDALQVLLVP